MIKVLIGTNTNRKNVIIPETTKIKDALNENDINYGAATVHLDGSALSASEMQKTFAEMGVTESCMLVAVIKSDNA